MIETLVQDNQEKVADMKNIYKEICQNYEKLEAAKLIADEKLVQSEDKNQQLEAIKVLTEEKLVQSENKNQDLLKILEAQEKTLLVKVSIDSY